MAGVRIFHSEELGLEQLKSLILYGAELSWSEINLAAREIAIYHANLLVLPCANDVPPKIWILAPKNFNEMTELQSRIQRLRLQPGRSHETGSRNCDVLVSALRFSIQTRLSPSWNRVGCFLFQGREFLRSSRPVAVRVELNYLDSKIQLAMKGLHLRFPLLNLDDLNALPSIVEEFKAGRTKIIQADSIRCTNVRVLPNLTQGRIVSITKSFLPSARIESWEGMRKYWKNLYGFRLVTDEYKREPSWFCNVQFFGTEVYSYPEWCVRPMEPCIIPRVDQDPIIESFLQDLEEKVPRICGQKLSFPRDRPSFPNGNLQPAMSGDRRGLDIKPKPNKFQFRPIAQTNEDETNLEKEVSQPSKIRPTFAAGPSVQKLYTGPPRIEEKKSIVPKFKSRIAKKAMAPTLKKATTKIQMPSLSSMTGSIVAKKVQRKPRESKKGPGMKGVKRKSEVEE